MIAAFLLLGAIVWLCIAAAVGWLAWRQTHKRLLQIAVSVFVLWLPFWDVIPGLYFYYKAIREVGGVRIYRTVQAKGYLDRTLTDCDSCWTFLRTSPYKYVEVQRTVPWGTLSTLEPEPGFYEYRLLPKGSPECGPFESLPNADRIRSVRGIRDLCVSSIHRSAPMSRYELSAETKQLPWGPGIYSRRVHDIQTNELLAESNQVYFTSWLGEQIGLPHWQFTETADGRHIGFGSEEIIVPE